MVVNLFDGGPRSRVAFSVGGGPAIEMRRSYEIDPSANELFLRHADVVKPWVKAEPSSHLWTGDLPDDLAPGTYTLTVRATDEFGRHHHTHRVLEIGGSSAPASDGLRYPGR